MYIIVQNGSKNLTHSPVLGKGLKSESVLLTSPRKAKQMCSENAKVRRFASINRLMPFNYYMR